MLKLFWLVFIFMGLTLFLAFFVFRFVKNERVSEFMETLLILPSGICMELFWILLLVSIFIPPARPGIEKMFG